MSKIYLIGDEKYSFEHTCKALTEDVEFFQLRLKNSTSREFYNQALEYKKVCFSRGIKFIINDRLDIAKAVCADGLHIGQDDMPFEICKKLFPNKIIGLTVKSIEEAKIAFSQNVSYIGVGAIYETKTKKNANIIGLEALKEISSIANCKIVAIGGIDVDNYKNVYKNGADFLAVCSGVLRDENPQNIVKILRKNP